MSVQRIHYSPAPIAELYRHEKYGKTLHDQIKPCGFWYSIGDAWDEWCKTEMPDKRGKISYAVDVSAAKLLLLQNAADVRAVNERFGEELIPGSKIKKIRWGDVAEKYDGIEVNPYLWALRMEPDMMLWYYAWDVPSGCVWNVDKITIRSI